MNHLIRKTTKEKDIYKTCDLLAIKNNDGSYFILYNRQGISGIKVDKRIFKEKLLRSDEPIVLSCNLFEREGVNYEK